MPPTIYADPASMCHDGGPAHPERPARLRACLDALDARGRTTCLAPRATPDQLARAHEPAYLSRLERFCAKGGGHIDADTYAVEESFEIAAGASGLLCAAVDDAMEGRGNAFCLVRPPGHHATSDQAMGFCLINHVAVGAAQARANGAARVAVVDIDVHHGNGTEQIFWRDPTVLYVSLHQYPWYPGTGALGDVGAGDGRGATVNIPLPGGATDSVYVAALLRIVVPALRRFAPEMLLVSAGFDAHTADPLASMAMTAGGYGALVSLLGAAAQELCGSRMVLSLEGGYDLSALPECLLAALDAMDHPWPETKVETNGAGSGPEGPRQCLEALEQAAAFHSHS